MTGGLSLWRILFDSGGNPLLIALLPLYLYALIKGDKTNRSCAHVLAIGVLLGVLLAPDQSNDLRNRSYGADHLGIETLLLAAQTVIALRSSRRYPVVMAAAQLLIVIAGALGVAGLIAQEKTRSIMMGAAALIQLSAFVIGLIAHRTRRRNAAATVVLAGGATRTAENPSAHLVLRRNNAR